MMHGHLNKTVRPTNFTIIIIIPGDDSCELTVTLLKYDLVGLIDAECDDFGDPLKFILVRGWLKSFALSSAEEYFRGRGTAKLSLFGNEGIDCSVPASEPSSLLKAALLGLRASSQVNERGRVTSCSGKTKAELES